MKRIAFLLILSVICFSAAASACGGGDYSKDSGSGGGEVTAQA